MSDITVYGTQTCPYCRAAEQFLDQRGVPYEKVDVTGDDEMRVKLVEMSGGRRTVPQIFIKGEAIGGYTDMMALHQSGKLEQMLGRQLQKQA